MSTAAAVVSLQWPRRLLTSGLSHVLCIAVLVLGADKIENHLPESRGTLFSHPAAYRSKQG